MSWFSKKPDRGRSESSATPPSVDRVEFWKEFLCTRCRFPAPDKLRAQLANATLHDVCPCGCNSFAVQIPTDSKVEPIAEHVGYGAVFEVDFYLSESGKTLEIVLFANEDGNLKYVEIDCCANSYPVPEHIEVGEPFHIHSSRRLSI